MVPCTQESIKMQAEKGGFPIFLEARDLIEPLAPVDDPGISTYSLGICRTF
jgi:hypothetical protein